LRGKAKEDEQRRASQHTGPTDEEARVAAESKAREQQQQQQQLQKEDEQRKVSENERSVVFA
jgi:hypothetical protein